MEDPIVALVTLDAERRGLTARPISSAPWVSMMAATELTGPGWMLAYEAAVKGWLPGNVAQHADFTCMANNGVSFYDASVTPANAQINLTPPGSMLGGGSGGGWSP
jgi:hypothetical protein